MAEQFANLAQTVLGGSVAAGDSTIPVLSSGAFPTSAQYRIRVDNELMVVTGGAGSLVWTVTRGAEGSPAAAHGSGATVTHVLTAGAIGGQSDPGQAVPGLRTLGSGGQQAMPGNTTLDLVPRAAATVDLNSQLLTNIANPVSAPDATTKAYVDQVSGSRLIAASQGAVGDGQQKDDGAITTATSALTGTFATTDAGKLIVVQGAGSVLASGTTTASILTGVTNNILQDTAATFTTAMIGATGWLRGVGVAGADIKFEVWDVIDTHNIHISRHAQVGAPANPVSGTIASGTTYAIAGDLHTTIVSATPTTATLTHNASNTVTGARYLYGTDNAAAYTALEAAIPLSAAGSNYGQTIVFGPGWFLSSTSFVFARAGLGIIGAGGQGYSNLLSKGVTKFTHVYAHGATPAETMILGDNSGSSGQGGGAYLRDFHVIGLWDNPGGIHIINQQAGKAWNVTVSDFRGYQAYGVNLDGGSGSGLTQYWEFHGCNLGTLNYYGVVGNSTSLKTIFHDFFGGTFDGMNNSLNIYPRLGSRQLYKVAATCFGTRFSGAERLVDSGAEVGGSHSPAVFLYGCRYEHFQDRAVYLEGWGSQVIGGTFSSSNSGGVSAMGISTGPSVQNILLAPGYYLPSNITMYDAAMPAAPQVRVIDPNIPAPFVPTISGANAGQILTAARDALAYTNTLEGGTNGVTVTPGSGGNSGGASGDYFDNASGAPTFDTTTAAHGTVALALATDSDYVDYTRHDTLTDWHGRACIYVTALPPTGARNLIQILDGTTPWQIAITSTGTIRLVAGGIDRGDGVQTVTANQWFRLEWRAINGSQATVRLYADPTTTTILETITGTGATGAAGNLGCRFGRAYSPTSATVRYDDIAVGISTWPGPGPTIPATRAIWQ